MTKGIEGSGGGESAVWAVCACNVCSGHLEFDAARTGETIACPHCGMETKLYVPGASSSKTGPACHPLANSI